ncbi:MAG: VOC family protein [Burkholderiaceae bacterium]
MNQNPVGWFEIYVQDMARAKKFYETVFEGKLEKLKSPDLEMWNFPMQNNSMGAAGALVKMEGVPSGGCSTIVYFRCNDCAAEEARVVPAGGKIHKKKMSIGEYGFISLVVDTEGNMIGLHSMQ